MADDKAAAYRWSDLDADSPMEKLQRRRVIGKRAMLAHLTLKKGCCVPMHRHENEQFACVLSGRIRFGLGAEHGPDHEELVLESGEVLYVPSNVPHSADALEETLVLDVFSPPSERTGIDRRP